MPSNKLDDDDYVASLLTKEAKDAVKKYELVGIDAFNPKRARSGAPKPNTNFLRHIIRQTDSHNAALLAKEAEESRARLKSMNRGKDASRTPPLDDDERRHKRRRRDHSDDEGSRDRRRKRRDGEDVRHSRSKRERDSERDRRKHKGKEEDYDRDDDRHHRRSKHSRHSDERERRHRHHRSSEKEETRKGRSYRRRRSYSRAASPARSASPRPKNNDKSSRRRFHSRSPRRRSRSPARTTARDEVKDRKRPSPSPASDSDPLEAIVGPLPPPKEPPVRSRGRGAHKGNSLGIDARFSSEYDPTADVQINSDVEDNFGDALEAYRDRQKWKQQGNDRLRAAGFTDAQIKKWEKGSEKGEEDVVWSTKGQKREWDRNKVFDEDGNTEIRADFGRLT